MSAQVAVLVKYVGFQVGLLVREYRFAVRDTEKEDLNYTLTISNEAFVAHRVRYQDAAEICSQRLHRELDTYANHPPTTSFCITDAELATYQESHAPKKPKSFQKRQDDETSS
jgi:hypothetical protein